MMRIVRFSVELDISYAIQVLLAGLEVRLVGPEAWLVGLDVWLVGPEA